MISMTEQSELIARAAAALYEKRDMRTLSSAEQKLVLLLRTYHMTTPPDGCPETGNAVHVKR